MMNFFILSALLLVTCHGGAYGGDTCTDVEISGSGDVECTCSCSCDVTCDDQVPEGPPPCTAGWAGRDIVTTYDGATYQMETNNKFLFTQYLVNDDQCKFQVRVDTEDAPDGSGPQVGWSGIAFGIHNKNDEKFERNFRVSLTQGEVEIRGRGYNPTPVTTGCYESDPFPEAWSFCVDTEEAGVFSVTGEVPSLGCWFTVLYEEAGSGANTGANDRITVDASDNYSGHLTGICGNRDADSSNDDQFCPGKTGDVSYDCIDGIHQNNG